MTVEEMKALFVKYDDEYIAFGRVENKRSQRPDIHAFILLDALVPGDRDMVCSSEHDEIYLEVEPEALAAVATKEQIIELIRCGVRIDEEVNSLAMFV